jgi:hypothetical protein
MSETEQMSFNEYNSDIFLSHPSFLPLLLRILITGFVNPLAT